MKRILFFTSLFFFLAFVSSSQSQIHEFGKPLPAEFQLTQWAKDPDAPGVILYSRGHYTVDVAKNYVRIYKKIHIKMKVFDIDKFPYKTWDIPLRKSESLQEKVIDLQAIVHNDQMQSRMSQNDVSDKPLNFYYDLKTISFPRAQNGSIIEIFYTIETPFLSNLGEWHFMTEIPTVYSELHTVIPGNISYNRVLFGSQPLDVNHAEIKKSCFQLEGYRVAGDCESATYAMRNVPAFIQENYMDSGFNYRSYLKFELIETKEFDNSGQFAKNWKEIDRRFQQDKNLGRQIRHASYFKEQLPSSILQLSDPLEKAKAVYYFIQERFTWNRERRTVANIDVKKAFDSKKGNSSEINLSLINALEAVGLSSHMVLISTRDRVRPSKDFPIITDFNYVIVAAEIGGKRYLLDATTKETPFGVLPFMLLNHEGRMMDFKKGSSWIPLTPDQRNIHYVNLKLTAGTGQVFQGNAEEISTGYVAISKRENDIASFGFGKIDGKEVKISRYSVENRYDLEQPFKEKYDVFFDAPSQSELVVLKPFVTPNYFSGNPFTELSRKYPIDFGFPITNTYLISIDLQDRYEVVKLPANRAVQLPNNDGELSVIYEQNGSTINLKMNLRINNTHFPVEAYKSLQEYFEVLSKIQNEDEIHLRKI